MPGGDRTGPDGMGPMTGRAAGYCAGYDAPGYMNPVPGRGMARGWGRGVGRGFARGFRGGRGRGGYYGAPAYGYPPSGYGYAPPTTEQQADMLRSQAEYFENALKDIKKRLEELEAGQEND